MTEFPGAVGFRGNHHGIEIAGVATLLDRRYRVTDLQLTVADGAALHGDPWIDSRTVRNLRLTWVFADLVFDAAVDVLEQQGRLYGLDRVAADLPAPWAMTMFAAVHDLGSAAGLGQWDRVEALLGMDPDARYSWIQRCRAEGYAWSLTGGQAQQAMTLDGSDR